MPSTSSAIQSLYVAYFNRPADPAGLAYWENVVAAAGGKTDAVSAAFSVATEYTDLFAGQTPREIIGTVYQNLFGHPADLPGLNYWNDAYASGGLTISNIVTALAAGAQGSDATAFADKVSAAGSFTTGLDTDQKSAAYTGAYANAIARGYLAAVVDDASLTLAMQNLSGTIAATVGANGGGVAAAASAAATAQSVAAAALATAGHAAAAATGAISAAASAATALAAAGLAVVEATDAGAAKAAADAAVVAAHTYANAAASTAGASDDAAAAASLAAAGSAAGLAVAAVAHAAADVTAAVALPANGAGNALVLGAEDDTVIVASLGAGASIDGAGGSNTLQMRAADAAVASTGPGFAARLAHFQTLALSAAAGDAVDVAALGGFHQIVSSGGSGALTINGAVSGDTLTLSGAGMVTVNQNDGGHAGAELLNVRLTGGSAFGTTVSAPLADTVHVTASEGGATATLALASDNRSVVVEGDGAFQLSTHSVVPTLFDASALAAAGAGAAGTGASWETGALVADLLIRGSASGGDVFDAYRAGAGVTIIETAGTNTLYGSLTGVNTLRGGAGADTIVGGTAADTLTGGGGADVIAGDAGADRITVSGDTSTIVQGFGASGVNAAGAAQTTVGTAGFDVVAGAMAGDRIDLSSVARSYAPAAAVVAAANLAGQDNMVLFASGHYDAQAAVFTFAAGGADTLMTYDADDSAGTEFEAVVLIGYHAGAATAFGTGLGAGIVTLG